MKLSRTSTYAIQAMVHVAQQDGSIVIGHKAAAELKVPEGFLLRILVALSRNRLLNSIKGPNGGYHLARPAKDITLLDIMEAADGPVVSSSQNGTLAGPLGKKLDKIFSEATQHQRTTFQKVKLSQLV